MYVEGTIGLRGKDFPQILFADKKWLVLQMAKIGQVEPELWT